MSEVIATNIQTWRQKSLEGTLTIEEMREAIAAIRTERLKAGEKGAAKRAAAAAKKEIDSDAMLEELGL